MLNLSKYHKLIVGCSAIATASVGGLVESANAAGQFNNPNLSAEPSTTLIAQLNGSTGGGVGVGGTNGSNAGGTGTGGGNGSTAGGTGTGGGNGSTAGGTGTGGGNGSTAGGTGTGGGNGSTAGGTGTGGGNGSTTDITNGSNGGGINNGSNSGGFTNGSNGGGNGSNGGGVKGFSPSQQLGAKSRLAAFDAAMTKYEAATLAAAALEAKEANASSKTSPVRYGREPGDVAACGCPNADTAANSTGTPSPELVAAKAAEAEAAAELAAAKAEAVQFIESVKSEGGNTSNFSPIW